MATGTLDRTYRPPTFNYPLYHTCNRAATKKKVTIMDSAKQGESEV